MWRSLITWLRVVVNSLTENRRRCHLQGNWRSCFLIDSPPNPAERAIRTLEEQVKAWDRLGFVRSGRLPKVTLDDRTVAEAGETLRFGGSSSADTRAPSIPPEPSIASDGESDSWTQVNSRCRFRAKTLYPEVVEAMKRLRGIAPILDGVTDVEMDSLDSGALKLSADGNDVRNASMAPVVGSLKYEPTVLTSTCVSARSNT